MENSNRHTALKWAKRLGTCPGVLAIFLSGSLAQGRGTKNSDIDFFFVARPGQIWTARFGVFLWLKLARKLAKSHLHAGRICPNHFITADRLEIQEKNAYSAHLFSHNQPLYDPYDIFSAFVQANEWVKDFGEHFPKDHSSTSPPKTRPLSMLAKMIELILEKLQTPLIKNNPEYKTPGASIILHPQELRFHPKPRHKDWSNT